MSLPPSLRAAHTPHPTSSISPQGLRRTELQSVLEEFNRRLGRAHFPAPTEEAAASASVPADNDGVLGIARRTITFGQLGAGERGGGATPGRTAQEMAARFK